MLLFSETFLLGSVAETLQIVRLLKFCDVSIFEVKNGCEFIEVLRYLKKKTYKFKKFTRTFHASMKVLNSSKMKWIF